MKRQKALNKNEGTTSILDLPEQIFRNIFRCISIQELFTTVRNVRPKFREYVDDYLPHVFVVQRTDKDLGSTIEIEWEL